jgi:hypothetical protein
MIVVCFLILLGAVPVEAEKPIVIRVNQEAITGGVSPIVLHNRF